MADVHHLSTVTFAENRILECGDICEALNRIPVEELAAVELYYKESNSRVPVSELLMNLSGAFRELAYKIEAHERAIKFREDLIKHGRPRPGGDAA